VRDRISTGARAFQIPTESANVCGEQSYLDYIPLSTEKDWVDIDLDSSNNPRRSLATMMEDS